MKTVGAFLSAALAMLALQTNSLAYGIPTLAERFESKPTELTLKNETDTPWTAILIRESSTSNQEWLTVDLGEQEAVSMGDTITISFETMRCDDYIVALLWFMGTSKEIRVNACMLNGTTEIVQGELEPF